MSATTDAIDLADAQVKLISGILHEALDLCERLKMAARLAENATESIAEVRREVEGAAT